MGVYVDLYIQDIDLAIEVDGPSHFFNNSQETILTIADRRKSRQLDSLRFNGALLDQFINKSIDGKLFTDFVESDFIDIKT